MQWKEIHSFFLNELKGLYNHQEAAAITSMVFESMAGVSKSTIITHPHQIVETGILQKLEEALIQLKEYKPVQYIIGHAWFLNLAFKVTPAVLVPRPETEELATTLIDFIRKNKKKNLLDIGTGSGCIAISIKKNIPEILVNALDISEEALLIAKENAATHLTDINWHQMNFLDTKNWKQLPVFDVIVSNPPYIPENEKELLDKNVTAHEPHLALFVPNNEPLIFYKKMAHFGKEHLSRDGSIFMETHELYAKEVSDYFSNQGYEVILKNDFFGKERMVIATHSR
jgi:release factor glutamine methyltransferase